MIKFRGLMAPTEVPTGDGRIFATGKLTHRPLPIPLLVRFGSGGHENATVVGKVTRIFDGPGGYWYEGEFLDPLIVPEVPKAVYMIQEKVMGPSVDLDRDFTVEAIKHPLRPDKKAGLFREGNIIGVTLVPMPAFYQVHMSLVHQDEPEKATLARETLLASAGVDISQFVSFTINGDSWKSWPIAPRDYKFDADDAVKRIAYWAGIGSREPNIDRYASAFLWRNGDQVGDSLAQDSFRLPLADVINGQLHLIYHAAYSAAALLSGAHGGLPNIPDQDKAAAVPVINEIYAACAAAFNDSNLISPFQERQMQAAIDSNEEDCGCQEMSTININVADGTLTFPSGDDNVIVDFNMAKIKAGVKLPYGPADEADYADPGYQADGVHRYPLNTEQRVRAAWSYINVASNAAEYTAEQLEKIKDKIKAAAEKYGIQISEEGPSAHTGDAKALLASVAPLAPPAAWFSDPRLDGPTKLTITADGHVFGHLARWKVCHVGIGNSCVMAPKSRMNYSLFRQGNVVCDDGSMAPVGKITLGTGHAHEKWGIMPSREHYDNTGWAAAVVNVGEDRHGIWVNGSLTTTMTPEKVAELRAAALSGDWRAVNGNLELIAALAVNNPGFPIYREQDNRAFSLMAVGVIGQDDEGQFGMGRKHGDDDEFIDAEEVEILDEDADGDVDGDDDEDEEEFASDEEEFAADDEEYDEEDVEEDDEEEDVDPEMAARLARLEDIDLELEEHNQEKRAALLAAIDAEREQLAEPKSGKLTPENEIFIQYNARFQALQEE